MIGGPRHSTLEALELCEQISGLPGPSMRGSPGMLKAMSALMSVVEKIIPVPESYSAEFLRVNAGVTYWGDDTKARRELGYDPRPFAEGLREALEYEMKLLGMSKPSV